MISISPYRQVPNIYKQKIQLTFKASDVSKLLSKGDEALNENKFEDALKFYNQALEQNPTENKIYRKIAKAQFGLKDYANAEKNFERYLKNSPKDTDCLIELGENLRQAGLYQKALANFEKAYSLDEKNDLAKRSILETKNNILSVYNPERAANEKKEYATKNLQEALKLTVNYMTPDYMKGLSNVTIQFGDTASMGGTSNIAQYENYKQTITVSNSYVYASPQVIAAYLAHESVHAKDNDPYTSIREEQDAYEIAAKFWMENSNGVSDPEMDYATALYKKSPSTLSSRVEEIYTLRDPSIAKTSPNHPPTKKYHIKTARTQAASQSLMKYNVIA